MLESQFSTPSALPNLSKILTIVSPKTIDITSKRITKTRHLVTKSTYRSKELPANKSSKFIPKP